MPEWSLPRVGSYGRYSNNYGLNTLRVEVGPLVLYYSYKTCVAFRAPGCGLVVTENYWGPTTGKHLKWIDGGNKGRRVNEEEFDRLWNEFAVPALEGRPRRSDGSLDDGTDVAVLTRVLDRRRVLE